MYLPLSDRVADGHVVEIQSTLARVSVRSEERFEAAEDENPLSVLESRPLDWWVSIVAIEFFFRMISTD